MSSQSEISQPSRVHPNSLANLRKFQPGNNANPGGFPQSVRVDIAYKRLVAMSDEEFDAHVPKNKAEKIARARILCAQDEGKGIGVQAAANKAAEIVADRVDGKPEQRKVVETISTQRLELSIIVQLRALARIDGKELSHDDALLEIAQTREKLEKAQELGYFEAIEAEYGGNE